MAAFLIHLPPISHYRRLRLNTNFASCAPAQTLRLRHPELAGFLYNCFPLCCHTLLPTPR